MALTENGDNWKSVEQSLNNIVKVLSFYEVKEAGVLFELALWKAKLDQAEDGANPVNRAACSRGSEEYYPAVFVSRLWKVI